MPRVHAPVIRWTGVVSMWCASSLLDGSSFLRGNRPLLNGNGERAALRTRGLGQSKGCSQCGGKVDGLAGAKVDPRLEGAAPQKEWHLRIVVPGAPVSSSAESRNRYSVGIEHHKDVSRAPGIETVRHSAGQLR